MHQVSQFFLAEIVTDAGTLFSHLMPPKIWVQHRNSLVPVLSKMKNQAMCQYSTATTLKIYAKVAHHCVATTDFFSCTSM